MKRILLFFLATRGLAASKTVLLLCIFIVVLVLMHFDQLTGLAKVVQ